jgi:hypothetical protein
MAERGGLPKPFRLTTSAVELFGLNHPWVVALLAEEAERGEAAS